MAITLGGTPLTGTDAGGTASVSVTINAGVIPDGSVVIAIHDNDFRDYVNMVAPVLSSFSSTMNFLGGNDGGSNLSHIKVWAFDYPAGAAASSRTLTCTETGTHDGDKGLSVWWFSGAAAAASALDALVASGSPSSGAGQSTEVLTGLTAAVAGEFLIGHVRTSNGAGTASYTSPASMTEQYDVANFTRFSGASEVLAASGATGTRTFTPASSVPWVGVLFALLPSGGATVNAAVTFGAAPTLAASGTIVQPAVVSFGAAPTLVVAGTHVQLPSVSFGAAPTLAAAGTIVKLGVVTFGAAPVLTAAGLPVAIAVVALGAAPTLVLAGLLQRFAAVAFGAAPVLSAAAGTPPVVPYVTAVLTPGAAGIATLTPGAAAPATLTASGLATATLTPGGL